MRMGETGRPDTMSGSRQPGGELLPRANNSRWPRRAGPGRDVILPGDMTDLMNKGTEAREPAEANHDLDYVGWASAPNWGSLKRTYTTSSLAR